MQAQRAGQEGEAQLQLQAFEAINEMVRYASQDTLPVVQQLVLVILQRLAQTVQPAATQAVSQERLSDLQVCNPAFFLRATSNPSCLCQ